MSLETLLEAAEFLESRGQGADSEKKPGQNIDGLFSESHTSRDGKESNWFHFVKERARTKSGSSSRNDVGNLVIDSPHNFVLRAGTREVHNKLEKNRRAHLKECFDFLKKNIPSLEDRRTSNLGILRSSLRYIQNLKRKEREFELEMQKFAREKILLQEHIQSLKGELHNMNIDVDVNAIVNQQQDDDNDSNSTSTATERGTPPPSDHDEQDDDEEEAEKLAMESNSPIPKNIRKRKRSRKSETLFTTVEETSFKLPSVLPVNGIIQKPVPSHTTIKSSLQNVIPITLSVSGPVSTPSLSVINTINPGPAAFEMGASGKILEIPPFKPPVTQILHRTLQQRQQALLTQKMSTTSTATSKASSAPLTVAQLKSPPLSQPPPVVTMETNRMTAQPPLVFKKEIKDETKESSVKPISSAVGISSSKVGSVSSGAPNMSIPYYMASLQKIAHPVLVTSLMAPAVGVQSSPATLPTVTFGAPMSSAAPVLTYRNVSKQEAVGTLTIANSNVRTLNTLPTLALVSTSTKSDTVATTTSNVLTSSSVAMRPIFAPNIISGQQLAWPFVTIPKSNVLLTSPTVVSDSAAVTTVSTNQISSNPLVSLAQLNQLTQMMTPMTVMSSGVQMTPSTLTQAQLNSMFAASPVLKQLPLGIPSTLLQPGQVLGQQVLKPIVVVTMPNVMTQSSATLPNNTALVTSSL